MKRRVFKTAHFSRYMGKFSEFAAQPGEGAGENAHDSRGEGPEIHMAARVRKSERVRGISRGGAANGRYPALDCAARGKGA